MSRKMDSLWDAGILDQKKLDELRGKDLRKCKIDCNRRSSF